MNRSDTIVPRPMPVLNQRIAVLIFLICLIILFGMLIPFPLPGIITDEPCNPFSRLPYSAALWMVVAEFLLWPDFVLLGTAFISIGNRGQRAGTQTFCFQGQTVALTVHIFHHRDGWHSMFIQPLIHGFDKLIGVRMLCPGIRKGDKVNRNTVLVKPN